MSYGFNVRMRQATCVEMSGTIKLRGTQRLFPVKYLFGEAKIAKNFLKLEKAKNF